MVSVSGVRGTIGGTLAPETACRFACAFGSMLGSGSTVVLGRDTRPSGAMVRNAVASGLVATGCDVIDLGVVTTPGVALMTRKLQADGGIVITASHNPKQYNGIKFLQPSGVGLTAEQAGRLKEIWQEGEFSLVEVDRLGSGVFNSDTHSAHVQAIWSVADVEAIARRGFKVVVDSINGAGCEVTPILLDALGCDLVHLNGEPTGQFAHEPEPIAENLTDLCKAVRDSGADVGFAQDPDADRLVIVDETGAFIGEEYTLALSAAFVLSKRPGPVATNLATSRMIDDVAAKSGVEVIRAPTGEANVVEAMLANDCIFGGEGNGGVIEPKVVPVRNSLVGIAYILQYLAETGRPLSELAADIPSYTLVKTKFPCPAGVAPEVSRRTREAFADRPGARFNDADGLRVDLDDSWLCVRASNTEPIMRIFAEAPDDRRAHALVDEARAIADAAIEEQA
jgi:phosphomannomutase